MANRPRTLDPRASPAALFGAELRAMRATRGLTLARLGQLVHVSGDLLGKIEKAERRVQTDLIKRLDGALGASGALVRMGRDLDDDLEPATLHPPIVLSPNTALPALRREIDAARDGDHAMSRRAEVSALVTHAKAAEQVCGHVERAIRPQLHSAIGEAYQLAGWMSFDQGKPARAEVLLGKSRMWAERASDAALAAFVLGPSLSFIATYGGNPALGVERAYGAMGWARRSTNRRLTAFTMAIGARAHARLGETTLALELLDQAHGELDNHVPDEHDRAWLAVFDHPALDGHRGSCLLDLGMPECALAPLGEQSSTAPDRFVRNRVIWQLDRVEALLRLGEIDQACSDLQFAVSIPAPGSITPRVHRRFMAIDLQLRDLPNTSGITDVRGRLRELNAANA